ncbi:hypothetical protein A6A29_38970 [Streptomyces sp. TSRI0281]|nr:hypothetical protein A6A29_38970 [Streptomyces sp. TSRI0281]
MLVIAEVVADLALQGGLQQSLRQLLQQPTLAGQLQTLGLSPGDQLVNSSISRLGGLAFGHVLTGHRCFLRPRSRPLHTALRPSVTPIPAGPLVHSHDPAGLRVPHSLIHKER